MTTTGTENLRVAEQLREASRLLESQGASAYRVHAYQRAADAVAALPRDVRRLYEAEGVRGLDAIPGVGLGIASAISEMLVSGRWPLLERLRGEARPEELLQMIPGVGPGLAHRIHERLHVDTLEGLEEAASDGRLETVPGVGSRRVAGIRASLESMLRRSPRQAGAASLPPVATLLEVDREYRERASAGTLRLIAPRRFNPSGEAWLPILHTSRPPWHFTVLYSNTALAHQLKRTRDWVVVFFYDGDHVERQCTIVTETRGELQGERVVRGREAECRAHHADAEQTVQ